MPGAPAIHPQHRDWGEYLAAFHDERSGITEEVLGNAHDGHLRPYAWCAEALAGRAPVLDVGCGSAPLAQVLPAGTWFGVDASEGEVATARSTGPVPIVRGRAEHLPVASGAAATVACTMALMLLQPLDDVLAELARVLEPGGSLVALLPARGPLSTRDRLRYARLLVAFRASAFTFPNDRALRDIGAALARGGFTLQSDERRRFVCDLVDEEVALAFVRSLYVRGASATRTAAAEQVARRWVGSQLGLPLRRIMATRA